jgi:hypothetical protein
LKEPTFFFSRALNDLLQHPRESSVVNFDMLDWLVGLASFADTGVVSSCQAH